MWMWSSDGMPLAMLTEDTRDVSGTMELRDGWLLSQLEDHTLCIWAADAHVLAEVTALVTELTVEDSTEVLQSLDEEVLSLVWKTDGHTLLGIDRSSGIEVFRFVSNARISGDATIVQTNKGIVVAGGAGGSLHFLRPNRALRRLMGLSGEEVEETN